MKKRLLFFFVGLVCSLVAMGASLSDLVPISQNYTLIADDVTSNGTVAIGKSVIFGDSHFLSDAQGLSVAKNKGSSTIGTATCLNSLRVKNNVMIAFKVAAACHVKVYHQSNSSRTIIISSKYELSKGDVIGEYSTTATEADVAAGQTVYVYSIDSGNLTTSGKGDLYIAGIEITGFVTADKAPTISVPTTYSGDTKHSINIKATVDGSPTPTIQWYSNTSASNEGGTAITGATGSTYQFAPSTPGTYYFYATAENKVKKVTSNVTTVTVDQAYQATFSKGEAIGTAPAVIYTAADGKLNVPTNYSLFAEGKTLASWTDGTNTYEPGKQYTISSDVALTPNFVANVKTLNDVKTKTTVQFIKSTSVAVTYQSSEKNAVVESVDIAGQKTDVAVIVQNGKFDLQPANGRAQTNNGTIVSIPVVDGSEVVIDIYDNKDNRTYSATINGEDVTPYLGAESGKQRVMTYTYSGDPKYIDYVVNGDNMYAYSINVTYPSPFDPTTLFSMKTAATGNVSIEASADHEALPSAANLTINGGSVTVSNGQESAKNLVTKDGFCMTNGNTFFTVTLDEALQAGDVITAKMSAAARGLKFATADGYSTDYPGEAAADVNFSYTVAQGDGICGETTFNVFRATSNSTYFNNFTITRPATLATVTVAPEVGYATFYNELEGKVANGKAYTATYNPDRSTISLVEIENGIIPAETGVIIEGEGDVIIKFSNTGATFSGTNDLQGTATDIAASSVTGGIVCVLGLEEGKAGFYKYEGTLAANKAYLLLATAPPAKGLSIEIGGETTGIKNVSAVAKSGVMYNLAGQRVNADAKGMVIINGKVVIKK